MIQPTGGEANIRRALNFVRSNILSEINLSNGGVKTRNIVVLISTDKSIDEAKDAAIRLRNDGVLIIKLKIGPSNQRLISRSTGSRGYEFRFENFDQLESKRYQIKTTICSAASKRRRANLRPRRFNTRNRYLRTRRGPIGPKGDRGLPGLPGKQGIPGESCSNCREVFNSLLLEQTFVTNKKQQSGDKGNCVPGLTENQVIEIVKNYFDEILSEKLDAIIKQKIGK